MPRPRVGILVLALTVVPCALTAQQTPPRDTPRPGGTTAAVRGRVTERDTGRPLRRMIVRFYGRGTPQTYEAITDADGRYAIDDLPAGEYGATASPDEFGAAHLSRSFGADDRPTFGPPPSFELKPGETRSDVDFVLARAHAIEGRVVNEYGEPMADLTVVGERVDRPGGARQPQTDDRGEFRLFGLSPGTWRVCAMAENLGFDRATSGNALQLRYVKTCGAAVVVKDSDVAGVLVQMQRERAYTISGHVVDEAGLPVERATMQVQRVERNERSTAAAVDYDRGRFTVRGVTPGEYVLRAQVEDPHDPYSYALPRGPRLFGVARAKIDAADAAGIVVTLTGGVDVGGRIVFDGAPPPAARSLRVYLRQDMDTQRLYGYSMSSVQVKDDFTFDVARVRGPVAVVVSGAPDGWVVKSVRYGDADVTDTPTEFRPPHALALVVTLTNRTARLSVRPVDERGQTVREAVVFVGPADPRRWSVGVTSPIRPGKDGNASTTARLPGDYLVAAVSLEDLAARATPDNDYLKAIAHVAQRLTLKEGEHPTVDVRIVKLPEVR